MREGLCRVRPCDRVPGWGDFVRDRSRECWAAGTDKVSILVPNAAFIDWSRLKASVRERRRPNCKPIAQSPSQPASIVAFYY